MKISEINKFGKDLELYETIDYIGKGFPVFLPKGAIMIKRIQNEVENVLLLNNYKPVKTPCLSNYELYQIEDRISNEKDMLFKVENNNEDKLYLRPYLSPFHCSIYKQKQYSYKNLPVKLFETSEVYRNEHDIKGLIKTRQFMVTQCSVFANPQEIEKSLSELISVQKTIIDKLGLQITYEVRNWDDSKKEEYIGNIDEWNEAIDAMKNALSKNDLLYSENDKALMYGPSIELFCGDNYFAKIQIDFEITHRFGLKFHDKNNEEGFPKFIHSPIIGSYENLIGILVNQYRTDFPKWLQ